MSEELRPRLLLIHRYVQPDIPTYGWILPQIARSASQAGYDVTIFSTLPSYTSASKPGASRREEMDGFIIERVGVPFWSAGDLGRAFAGLLFSLRAFFRVLLGRYNVVMCATAPPVLLARLVSAAATLRRATFIYHCQDIHPEISAAEPPVRWPFVKRLLQSLDRRTCEVASRIIVLSEDMRASIAATRGVPPERVEVINNFRIVKDEETDEELVRSYLATDRNGGAFRIVFSGNLGRFQGLSSLIDGMALARTDRPLQLIFVGRGAAERALRAQAERENLDVRFLGHLSKGTADRIVAACDLAVISLSKDLIRYAYPSKTFDYLDAGTMILAIAEPESALASLIVQNGLGFVAEPGEVDQIARAIESAVETEWTSERRRSAIETCASLFDSAATKRRWRDLFKAVRPHG